MEQAHRNSINGNIVNLINIENSAFNNLLNALKDREVFPQLMLDDLEKSQLTLSDKKLKLFLDVQRRGPDAFEGLVQSLRDIGNNDLALLLKTYDPERQTPDREAHVSESEYNSEGADEVDTTVDRSKSNDALNGNLVTKAGRRQRENQPHSPKNNSSGSEDDMTLATDYNNGEGEASCYRMKSKPRGLALVINVIHFPLREEERKGASYDTENLEKLFKQLNFKCTVVLDPTLEDLKGNVIDSFIDKFSTENVDCCMVVVMSHGKNSYLIKTSDGKYIDFNALIHKKFRNGNFKSFCKKPKVFFIQACRGKSDNHVLHDLSSQSSQSPERDTKKRLKYDGSFDSSRIPLKSLEDTLIVNSTIPGFRSMRDEERGTIFIETICNVIRKHSHNTDLEKMINIIQNEMDKKGDVDDSGRPIRQNVHSEKIHPFLKIFLNPGLFSTED